jgi:hypothetical protein
MSLNFAFFMDVTILVLLAATVYLAFRLSIHLRHFRDSRHEMEGLLVRLMSNIERAEGAIAGLQNSADTSGAKLHEIVNESKFLADELKFMNEAGNNLAERLEKIAEKNRMLVDEMEGHSNKVKAAPISFKQHEPFVAQEIEPVGFMIQDRDYDDELSDDDFEFGGDLENSGLQSQAERELYEALNKKQRKHGVGRA